MARTRKLTYPDRVVHYLCRRGPAPFDNSAIIEEMLDNMIANGEPITKMSRACIKKFLKDLTLRRLIRLAPDGLRQLSAGFAAVVEKISKLPRLPDAASLRKRTDLIDLNVYQLKATTKEQLYDMCLELQDKLEVASQNHRAAVLERNTATQHFNATIQDLDAARKERDDARKERDVAVAERDESRARCTHFERRCEELEFQRQMGHGTQLSPTMLSREHTLQRVPTLPDIPAGPTTPARPSSRNVLPTPPTTEARPRRQLGRNPSELSYLGQLESEDVTMQESEQTQASRARTSVHGPQTPTPQMAPSFTNDPSSADISMDSIHQVLEDAKQMLQTYAAQQSVRDRTRDATEYDLQQQLAKCNQEALSLQEKVAESEKRARDLQQQVSQTMTVNERLAYDLKAMEDRIQQHQTDIQEFQQRLQDSERQRVEQSLQCHEARGEVASMHIRMTNLNIRLAILTERHAEMATLANRRIRELTEAGVEGDETILRLRNLYHWFGQQAGALMNHLPAMFHY
ncbi:hypothetical protein OH77DRAFT_1421358 [Trametes cingulata]|nr:hypothetical protein OH77DRAFT_1421358 [Trametes cingulata]